MTGTAYNEQDIIGMKQMMKLKRNKLLVSNDVNGWRHAF